MRSEEWPESCLSAVPAHAGFCGANIVFVHCHYEPRLVIGWPWSKEHWVYFLDRTLDFGFIIFTILSPTPRNKDAAESALPTVAPFIAATQSPSGSFGGSSRGSWSVETAPLRRGPQHNRDRKQARLLVILRQDS